LVLEVSGMRSGKRIRNPLIYATDGDRFVLVAANGGSSRDPNWWVNLRKAGKASIYVFGRCFPVTAHEAGGEERDRLWDRCVEAYPPLEEYKRFTVRKFPLIVLTPESRP
jgi:deazaflavin-dependent oxidoreductase (nitroreductase family)